MRTLIFDTETTGFVNMKRPSDFKVQPHLVQLGAILVERDIIMARFSLIVDPGVPVPCGAAEVHGITSAVAERYGVKPIVAVSIFNNLLKLADRIAGHNLDFDLIVMRATYLRSDRPPELLEKDKLPRVCTMLSSSPVLDLPPTAKMIAAGFNKPKAPKLEEAIKFFFDEEMEGAHDALVDVLATERVLAELEDRGVELVGGKQ